MRASARRWSAVRGSSAGVADGAFGGQERPQFGHAVLAGREADSAFGHGVVALCLDRGRGRGGDGAADAGLELGEGLFAGLGQHAGFDVGGGLGVQGGDGVGQGAGV